MKKYPDCTEEIQDGAIVCRYCGRDLRTPIQPAQPIVPIINPAQQTEKPQAKNQPGLLARVAIVVVICCALLFTRAVATSNPRVTPTTTVPSEGANNLIVSTYTAVSSVTPAPTKTRAPTHTPAATRTAASTVDPYVLMSREKFLSFRDAFLNVTEYVQQAGEDVTLILEKDWKTKTGLALGVLNFRVDELAKLQPSPRYEKLQAYFVEIAKETHLFTETYANGIDNLDSNWVSASTQHLQNMTTIIQDATLELDRLNSNP